MLTPADLWDPLENRYRHVTDRSSRAREGKRPFQAQAYGNGSRTPIWSGPRRFTALEAAQDYCDYANGQDTTVQVHTGRSGRPDYMKVDGVLHMDLPGEAPSNPSKAPRKRRTSPERDFMLRMEPVMRGLMRDGDIAEAKANIGRQSIATATGQLLMRHFEVGRGRMFMVLPSEPDATVRAFLLKHQIQLVTEKGGTA